MGVRTGMTEPIPDTAWLRQASAHRGAVARVGAVGPAERARPVDPARITDPRWADWPRPDPARIAIGDITQFQGLVYGPAGRPLALSAATGSWSGMAAAAAVPSVTVQAAGTAPHLQLHPHAPPADRIASTLQHLRGLRGL